MTQHIYIYFQEIPQSLWFLSVTLHQRRQLLLDLVKKEKEREKKREITTVHGKDRGSQSANEQRHVKTNVLVSDLVRHKPGCTATKNG